jgi:hypothetical protein
MTSVELIQKIIIHLHQLDDEALEDLLSKLERDITDENLDIVTYGANDTEHLLNSPQNAKILYQTMEELQDQALLTFEQNPYVA